LPTRLVIIGGSDAGIAAAVRARELAPEVDVVVLVADRFPNYSICGLPYLISGEVSDARDLAHRTRADLERTGMQLALEHEATSIDPVARTVQSRTSAGAAPELGYDRLVVATGAEPIRPPLQGLDTPGVHVLHTMDHALALQHALDESQTRSAIIVGAGYIGLELAEALVQREIGVTLVEQGPEVLPTVDPPLGAPLRRALVSRRVDVRTGSTVAAIEQGADGLRGPTPAGCAALARGRRASPALGMQPGRELVEPRGHDGVVRPQPASLEIHEAGVAEFLQLMAVGWEMSNSGACSQTQILPACLRSTSIKVQADRIAERLSRRRPCAARARVHVGLHDRLTARRPVRPLRLRRSAPARRTSLWRTWRAAAAPA
jgi:NADH dehydrogenase FAD-containing subunit